MGTPSRCFENILKRAAATCRTVHSGQPAIRPKDHAMRLIAVLLMLWALFGCAVVVMMIYGVFAHVAMNEPVMAAVLATGTALLASLAGFVSARRHRDWTKGP
jgi:hypothetical protein